MNRIAFILIYSAGIVATWLAGNPWSRVNYILLEQSKAASSLTASFLVALLAPVVLIAIAFARGKVIARPRLFLFPLFALCVSALAFAYGWLSRGIAGGQPTASGFLPMPVAIFIGLVSAFGPFILHVAGCVIGSKDSAAELSE